MLGAVHVDIHKKEREYENVTLSDENVVKYLIEYRTKVDVTYGANTNINANEAGDMFEFNQELICLYASLDEIIKKIELKEREENLLELILKGNTIPDVIKYYDYPKKTAYRLFNKIVEKIVEENDRCWRESMEWQGYVLVK